jgi:RNA polymerase sigma-70 factor (ECF subfamily)
MGVPPSDVEDLVQEIFLTAHRRLAAFDGRKPGGWLFQIARRKGRDYRRSKWVTSVAPSGDVRDDRGLPAAGPDVTMETEEKRRALQRLMGSLSQGEREALLLFEVEGASGHGIAEMQGVTLNTVWSRLRTGRLKLNRALAELEPGWVGGGKRKG